MIALCRRSLVGTILGIGHASGLAGDAYVRLFKGDNDKHLCFFAGAASMGDTDEEDLGEEGEQHVSPLIAGVQGERPPVRLPSIFMWRRRRLIPAKTLLISCALI